MGPNPYGSDPQFLCPECGGFPIGGQAPGSSVKQAIASSSQLGVAWATVDGVSRPFCGTDHLRAYQRDAARGNHAAAEPMTPEPTSSRAWIDVATGTGNAKRELALRCGRCTSTWTLDQSRSADGAWGPDLAKTATIAGWTLRGSAAFCSRGCASQVPVEPQPVVPVLELADASYQAARARAVGGTDALLAAAGSREIRLRSDAGKRGSR